MKKITLALLSVLLINNSTFIKSVNHCIGSMQKRNSPSRKWQARFDVV